MSFKNWYESQKNETRIENNDTFMKYFRTLKLEEKILLYGNNKEKFKKIFGRQTACWQGFERHWVWRREYKSKTFLVFSATNKGTVFELIGESQQDIYSKETGEIMIDFVKELISKLEVKYYDNIEGIC